MSPVRNTSLTTQLLTNVLEILGGPESQTGKLQKPKGKVMTDNSAAFDYSGDCTPLPTEPVKIRDLVDIEALRKRNAEVGTEEYRHEELLVIKENLKKHLLNRTYQQDVSGRDVLAVIVSLLEERQEKYQDLIDKDNVKSNEVDQEKSRINNIKNPFSKLWQQLKMRSLLKHVSPKRKLNVKFTIDDLIEHGFHPKQYDGIKSAFTTIKHGRNLDEYKILNSEYIEYSKYSYTLNIPIETAIEAIVEYDQEVKQGKWRERRW